MTCIVLAQQPATGHWHQTGGVFHHESDAKRYIKKQLSYRSLMASAMTYVIIDVNQLTTYDETNPPD